jgi:hypothetical protein
MEYLNGGTLGDQIAYPKGGTWNIPKGEPGVSQRGALGDQTAYPMAETPIG